MVRARIGSWVVVASAVWGSAGRARAADDLQDLLRAPGAKVESTTAPGGDVALWKALADGDPKTATEIPVARGGTPVEVVYGFGGETVSPERLLVTLAPGGKEKERPVHVAILVSTVSPSAGFHVLRADPFPERGHKEFRFPADAAKWVLLRFTPAAGAERIAIGEVEVLGRPGPPASRYAFSESPAAALDVLARLEKVSALSVQATPDEKALFARAQAGPLDGPAFLQALLLASGVTDAGKRAEYAKRVEALAAAAARAVPSTGSVDARGEALLRFLHAGPMKKGYVSEQTDLSRVLDDGTFNCVSSAALFDLLAHRLGLDARAIEVPDHAFSIVYDGTRHMDVETTTPEGFNPARNPAAQEQLERTTGFRYIPDHHRDRRREVGPAGLAAIVYYNHGVMLGREDRHHEALLAYFRAMSLDREFDSAVKNALATLASWGVALGREKKYEQALDVVRVGLALAPADATLRNNHAAVWSQWAEAEIEAGRADEALAVLKRAEEAVGGGRFEAMQPWVFLRAAEERASAKRFEEALAASAPGLERLSGKPREDLVSWRGNLHLRWFSAEVEAKRFDDAAAVLDRAAASAPDDERIAQNVGYLAQEWLEDARGRGVADAESVVEEVGRRWPASEPVRRATVSHYNAWALGEAKEKRFEEGAVALEKGLARFPDDGTLRNNVAWLVQEWTRDVAAREGTGAAGELARRLAARFPGVAKVSEAGTQVVRRTVNEHVRGGRFVQALAALDEARGALTEPEDEAEIATYVYGSWTSALLERGEFAEAADVFARALDRLPDAGAIRNNVAYLAQEWAKSAAAKEGLDRAAEVLRSLRARFRGVDLADVARSHVVEVVKTLSKEKKWEEAVAAAAARVDLLAKPDDLGPIVAFAYDAWSKALSSAGDWQGAVDVYARALERFPEDSNLERAAAGRWDAWARTHFQKDWDAAIAVYDRALVALPGQALLTNNRRFAQQQKEKAAK